MVDLRKGYEKHLDEVLAELKRTGFEETGRVDGYVAVFRISNIENGAGSE